MTISYARMPHGSEGGGTAWMAELPARYRDGERGFDRRIMEELAAVGVPCYTLDDLANGPRTIPPGIPVFVDWLTELDDRIPGSETEHRATIRMGLIRNLIDPAARGDQRAIEALLAQFDRNPPVPEYVRTWAAEALKMIAGPKDFAPIARLMGDLPKDGTAVIPLVGYLGKVKTDESRDLAVRYLDTPARGAAIKALVQMKATGVRRLIEPLVDDRHPPVRKVARSALEKLAE